MSLGAPQEGIRGCRRQQALCAIFWAAADASDRSHMPALTPCTLLLSPRRSGGGRGFVVIQRYGEKWGKTKSGKRRRPVRLLYSGANHYDLLLAK